MAKKMVGNYDDMIKRKQQKTALPRKRENIKSKDEVIVTQEMVDNLFDAIEDEEMCKYLGITDWDEE